MRQTGAAATETVIVIVPMLLLVLGLMQLAQLGWASLLVRYAAYAAARSAMVVLPEGDLARERRPAGDPRPLDGTPGRLGGVGASRDATQAVRSWARSPRYEVIQRAAAFVTAAVLPPLAVARDESVASALGGQGGSSGVAGAFGSLAGRAASAALATTTAIVDPSDPDRYLLSVPPRGEFVVRVTLLFPCRMPLVGRLLCRPFDRLSPRPRRELAATGRDVVRILGGGRFAALVAEVHARAEGLP